MTDDMHTQSNAEQPHDDDLPEIFDMPQDTDEEKSSNTDDKAKSPGRKQMKQFMGGIETGGEDLKEMFTDLLVSGEWVKRHWKFLLLVFACLLLFVTNRYQAQMEIIEEAQLKKELNEWKYIWLTKFSTLTRSTRQSNIEKTLKERGDSTLTLSTDAPFIIVEE